MLKKETRYDSYAYRIADLSASAALIASDFEEGMLLQFDTNGELEKADGTKPAFMAMSSARKGRDQFVGKTTTAVSVMFGPARVSTTNFVAEESYAAGTPLYAGANGLVTTTKGAYLVGYAVKEPVDGHLTMFLTVPVPTGAGA